MRVIPVNNSQYLRSDLPRPSGASQLPAASRRVDNRVMVTIATGLLFVVGAVSLARWQEQVIVHPVPSVAPVATRQLNFIDVPNGGVSVEDVVTHQQVGGFARGEGSFVRGVIRSLVRQRQLRGVSSQAPFLLSQFPDGRLILEDPISGGRIELQAFGATNADVFRAFLSGSGAMHHWPMNVGDISHE